MTTEERVCLEVAFKHAIERWQNNAAKVTDATHPSYEHYYEGGIAALNELQATLEGLEL